MPELWLLEFCAKDSHINPMKKIVRTSFILCFIALFYLTDKNNKKE